MNANTEQNERWTDYIVGFRRRRPICMIVASIFYAFCVFMLFMGTGSILFRIFCVLFMLGVMYIMSCLFTPPAHMK